MKRFLEIFVIGTTLAASGCGSNSTNTTTPPIQQDPGNPYFANNCYQGYTSDSVMVVRTNPATGAREFGYIPRNLYTEDYARRVAAGDPGVVFCPINLNNGFAGNWNSFNGFVGDHYSCQHRFNGYWFYLPTVNYVPWWGYAGHSHFRGGHNHWGFWWRAGFRF